MAYEDYMKAQKLGLKAYRDSINRGRYPYLPVLDDILPHVEIEGEIYLGTEDIPLNQVVGTSTFGRTQAFASNFMPLLKEGSEFSMKWARLATAQETEGIRDPIKVYEYLGKYYVVEGNKRVSVLKYFQAATVRADVTRKLSKKTEDTENRIYYEYIDFYNLTGINYLRFTKPGSFAKLLEITGKDSKSKWTEDECKDFSFLYSEFEKAFIANGGDYLKNITISDALLFYLSLYPYKEAKEMSLSEIRRKLDKIWPEIILSGKNDSVELLMSPAAEKKTGTVESMLQKIIPTRKKKIAFVYDKSPASSDWIYGHDLGRVHLQEALDQMVETHTFITNGVENAEEMLEEICSKGFDIIFTVTPQLIKACLKAAVAHPETVILNCALNSPHNAVRTYYTRMYEAKFLTGMIAGSICTNDRIGYVADYPIYGEAATINAFALGAKMVNPRAKVYLAWSSVKDFDVDNYFKTEEISYISSQDMITPQNDNRQFGLYKDTAEGKKNLALSIYHWGPFYEKLVKSIIRGSFQSEEAVESRAINYWWGLSAGVIDVICSNKLPLGTIRLIDLMKKNISSGQFYPFLGPLTDQNGRIHYKEAKVFKPEDLMKMDWLVENVIGSIPTLDLLKESAKPIVQLRGLYAATTDEGGTSLL